ncbi:MAG: family 10 glycosylhydrolase [Oscillospiraceae bacterium]|nr:family 10 glycosylhydrolase [Oscillospiraceae bacterium]
MFAFKTLKNYLIFIILIAALFSGCSSDEFEPMRFINADGAESVPLSFTNAGDSVSLSAFTTADALSVLRAAAGLIELTPEQAEDFGINPNESPTTADALRILRIVSGFPSEQTPPVITGSYTPFLYDEVIGVWISFIELQTAFSGRTEAGFRSNFAAMMENCKNMGINTVYVHVRGHGDAYYKSELFPWAKQITGTMGAAPGFDPLAIMIEEAHARNISFRAWLNPMRLMSDADMQKVSADYTIGKWYRGSENGTHIVKIGEHWYLNPAYPEVRQLIADGAAEILRGYNVDGIHIDDYFYPPNCGASFDNAAFASSPQTDLTAFRLDNTTRMVKALHDTVKSINSSALFGISPQGSIGNCYDIYADVRKWASAPGYCDYIAPQLYYGFLNAAQPFERCLAEWEDLVRGTDIKLIAGLAVYKIGEVDAWAGEAGRNEWITDGDTIIERKIEILKHADNYGGYIFFSYRFL